MSPRPSGRGGRCTRAAYPHVQPTAVFALELQPARPDRGRSEFDVRSHGAPDGIRARRTPNGLRPRRGSSTCYLVLTGWTSTSPKGPSTAYHSMRCARHRTPSAWTKSTPGGEVARHEQGRARTTSLQRPVPVVIGNEPTPANRSKAPFFSARSPPPRWGPCGTRSTMRRPRCSLEVPLQLAPAVRNRFWKAIARASWLYPFDGLGRGPDEPQAAEAVGDELRTTSTEPVVDQSERATDTSRIRPTRPSPSSMDELLPHSVLFDAQWSASATTWT